MTPISCSAKPKVDLNATTPLLVKSGLPVSKWAKVKNANSFVKKTKKQAEESRQIINSFGSSTKVAAWQMRERAKQGGAGGVRVRRLLPHFHQLFKAFNDGAVPPML
jgi:hypothetical protein